MDIIKNLDDETLTVKLVGRLDTTTAPSLEGEISKELESTKTLIFDFEKLDYVSSAGLRVLLACQKTMNTKGTMTIKHVKDEIYDVFEMTGFLDILHVER